MARRLFSAVADLAQLAGWMSYDLQLHATAQRYFLLGMHLAKDAGDRPQVGRMLYCLARQMIDLARYREALDLAQTGVYAIRRSSTPKTMALLHVIEARAHAGMGQARDCYRALGAAQDAFAQAGKRHRPGLVRLLRRRRAVRAARRHAPRPRAGRHRPRTRSRRRRPAVDRAGHPAAAASLPPQPGHGHGRPGRGQRLARRARSRGPGSRHSDDHGHGGHLGSGDEPTATDRRAGSGTVPGRIRHHRAARASSRATIGCRPPTGLTACNGKSSPSESCTPTSGLTCAPPMSSCRMAGTSITGSSAWHHRPGRSWSMISSGYC